MAASATAASKDAGAKPGGARAIVADAAAKIRRSLVGVPVTVEDSPVEEAEEDCVFPGGDKEAIEEILRIFALSAARACAQARESGLVLSTGREKSRSDSITFAVAGPGVEPFDLAIRDDSRDPATPMTPAEADLDLREYAVDLADVGLGGTVGHTFKGGLPALTLTLTLPAA